MVVIYARLFCLILSSSLVIYYGLAEGAIMWLFLLLSYGCAVHYCFFQALVRTLLSVVIFDKHINVESIVVTRMPPKRGQSYTERVNKRRLAVHSLVQPPPSLLRWAQS